MDKKATNINSREESKIALYSQDLGKASSCDCLPIVAGNKGFLKVQVDWVSGLSIPLQGIPVSTSSWWVETRISSK